MIFNQAVYLLQPFQIPYGRREEQAENHVDVVGEALAALLLIAHEVYHHVCFVKAHRDGYVALVYYAERHGGVGRPRSDFLYKGIRRIMSIQPSSYS